MPKETLQVSVYQIDKTQFRGMTEEDICKRITDHANDEWPTELHFQKQELQSNLQTGAFTLRMFYANRPSTPKWVAFWKTALKPNEKMLTEQGLSPSYIAFAWKGTKMYAMTGGLGNFAVQNFINPNFGTDIISRLITDKTDAIKSLQERGIIGSLLGSTKFFRSDSRLSDEDEFGKFYKTVQAKLDTTILEEKFGFLASELKRGAGCIAKSSFQLNKAIDFPTLMEKVLPGIDAILRTAPKFRLNKVQLIPRQGERNKAKRMELRHRLVKQLYERYQRGRDCDIDFDLCHRDFDKYISAEATKVMKGTNEAYEFDGPLIDVDVLFSEMRADTDIEDADEMERLLLQLQIRTYDDEKELTRAKFFDHVLGDVRIGNKTYFFVEGDWYEIDAEFVTSLNEDCQTTIRDNFHPDLLSERWNDLRAGRQEDDYNQKFIGHADTLVLHRVKPDGIELCDILKWDDQHVYLIHVKEGFNNMMRDLAYQSYLSARRVFEDRKNGCEFLASVYDSMASCTGSASDYMGKVGAQAQGVNRQTFLDLFQGTRKPVSVVAIVDESQRDLQSPMTNFRSNIAKFALVDLYKKLKMQDFGFRVVQIRAGS